MRSLNTGGKSDTRLKLTVPLEAAEITKRLAADGVSCPVFNVTLYCVHLSVMAGTVAVA